MQRLHLKSSSDKPESPHMQHSGSGNCGASLVVFPALLLVVIMSQGESEERESAYEMGRHSTSLGKKHETILHGVSLCTINN